MAAADKTTAQADLKLREALAFSMYEGVTPKDEGVTTDDALTAWRNEATLRESWRKEADLLQERLTGAGLKVTYTESKKTDKLIADLVTHPARVAYELGQS